LRGVAVEVKERRLYRWRCAGYLRSWQPSLRSVVCGVRVERTNVYNLHTSLIVYKCELLCGCRFSTALQLERACSCTCSVPCAAAAR
jgi:hypothetical protein